MPAVERLRATFIPGAEGNLAHNAGRGCARALEILDKDDVKRDRRRALTIGNTMQRRQRGGRTQRGSIPRSQLVLRPCSLARCGTEKGQERNDAVRNRRMHAVFGRRVRA